MTPTIQQISQGVLAMVNFSIAAYVFAKNPFRLVNWVFFIFVLGMASWVTSIMLLGLLQKTFLIDFVMYGGHTMIFGLMLLARVFPARKNIGKMFWLWLIPMALIFVITPLRIFVADVIFHPGGGIEPILGPAFSFLNGIVGFYVLFSILLFIRTYRGLVGLERIRMAYLFFGAAVFCLGMFIFDVLLPFFGIFQLNIFGPMFSVVFVGFVAYAIIRHQLMDIRVIIQRGTIYTALVTLFIGFYVVLVLGIGEFFGANTGMSTVWAGGMAALFGIFTVHPLERFFRKLTDPIFFKGRYDYSTAMHMLSEVLNANVDLREMQRDIALALQKIFRAADVVVTSHTTFIEDPDVTTADCRIMIPLYFEGNIIGALRLGPKRSGDPYTAEDITLLKTFANQAVVALEKARLYTEVRGYSENLERRIAERTADLKSSHETQRQIMLDIAHGLQTPLTVVRGNLELLRSEASTVFQSQDAEKFEKSLNKVSRFIYDLLKLANIESGVQPMRRQPMDLSAVIAEVVEYVGVVCQERGIALESSIEPGIMVCGEKERIEDAVTNLLSNAVKYTEKVKDPHVRIAVQSAVDAVRIEVIDNGPGIAPEDLPHVFDRFYRKTINTGNGDPEGTGLGLAITKAIVEAPGGSISVSGKKDQGTTFTIMLPTNKVKN